VAHPNDMKKEHIETEMKEMNRGYKYKEPFGTLKWAHWKQKWKNHWTGTLNDRMEEERAEETFPWCAHNWSGFRNT